MEKLNEFLQTLLSTCSEELHLEPDRKPYVISQNAITDVSSSPILGTQISTIVFPLIPPEVKARLPHSSEIEFVFPHNLGNFNFIIQKSPAGFNVTIRPMLDETNLRPTQNAPLGEAPELPPLRASPDHNALNDSVPSVPDSPAIDLPLASYDLEPPSAGIEYTAAQETEDHEKTVFFTAVEVEQPAESLEYASVGLLPEVDVVSVSDPVFITSSSSTSTYEPQFNSDGRLAGGEHENGVDDQPLSAVPPPPDEPASPPKQPETADFVPSLADADTAQMDALFSQMAAAGASDLHLSVSVSPMMRADGKMKLLQEGGQPLTAEAMKSILTSIMPAKNQGEFAARHDTDFAYEIPGLARFRCNIFMDRKGMGAVFRIIPTKILTAEQLGLSKPIMDLCSLSKGLVVVTGPTGSGKSMTLCAMVDSINKTREDHIITIEDPIEFVHDNHKCLVNQREVHNHTDSFKDALRAALREDPDILLVGEMRDLETISIAIETAETGHLVFGTLHTTTAASTIDRIIDQFPADRQQQIRVMLSESLRGVIAQTLLPKIGGGRVAALEVLIVTPAISNLIREGKTFQIPSAMQTGKNIGMVMLNDALFEHVKNGVVEPRDAYIKAVDKTGFETMLTRGGFTI